MARGRRWPAPRERGFVGWVGTSVLGVALLLLGLLLVDFVVELWPTVERVAQAREAAETQAGQGQQGGQQAAIPNYRVELLGDRISFAATGEGVLLLLVIVAAALGAYLHLATSFATYTGNRRFRWSWLWWYLLRPVLGPALALLVYWAIRGGVLTAEAESNEVNPFGIAAISALVGLFSKQATDKLSEVFATLFSSAARTGDEERADGATNPAPILSGSEPSVLAVGAADTEVTLLGEGFTGGSELTITRLRGGQEDTVERSHRLESDERLLVTLLAEDVAQAGTIEFSVLNPEPGGGSSEAIRVAIH